ncbi:MAG: peptidylprolyl isomerase [Flavobacteriales bacterium]|nr:peptidylprolyl isomerase [Flavobacteriales bacterium]
MKKFCFALIIAGLLSACLTPAQKEVRSLGIRKGIVAKIETEKGFVFIDLFYKKTPLTVANFIGLAEGTIPNEVKKKDEPYYDGLKFFKVFRDSLLITGCPKNNGSGQPGYLFKNEIDPELKPDKKGVVCMYSYGPNTNGSQFAICLKPVPEFDSERSIFGQVLKGMDVLDKIQQGDELRNVKIIRLGRKAERFSPGKVFTQNGFDQLLKKDGK